jgi:hypothetical protein
MVLGARTATILPRFDLLHLLLRQPLVAPLPKSPAGSLAMLVELLLGARVLPSLIRSLAFALALALRVGERDVPSLPLPQGPME